MSNKNKRRTFIKKTATAGLGLTIVPRHILGGKGWVAPSDRVNIGLIGAGGRGKNNLKQLFRLDDVRTIALADPAPYWDLANFYYRTQAGREPIKAFIDEFHQSQDSSFALSTYEDFKQMLDQEKDLDGILIATPDHTHAYISAYCMRAGLPVYCEKPLTHNIWEARQLRKIAEETCVATQMGNQLHVSDRLRGCLGIA